MDANDHTAAQASRPRRRWLRWLGGVVLALLVVLAASAWWLLGTGAGLRFALARVNSLTDGAVSVQQAQGRLIGPLDLAGVRYADGKGLDVRVAKLHLDLRFWPLLARRVHVLALQADGVEVALPRPAPENTSNPAGFSL